MVTQSIIYLIFMSGIFKAIIRLTGSELWVNMLIWQQDSE